MLDERRLLTLTKAPRKTLHGGLDGVALALARGDRRVGRLHGQFGRFVVIVVAADRVLELAHALPHRASDLWESLGAEQQQRQQQQQNDLPRADVWHVLRVAVWTEKWGSAYGRALRNGAPRLTGQPAARLEPGL